MNIILATEVIHPGGAETFVLRLASALQKRGNHVIIFAFYKDLFNEELRQSLAPDVQILWPEISWLSKKIDSAFFRLKIDYSLKENRIKKALIHLMKALNTNIIHSHLLKVDKIALEAAAELRLPVVTTIHGDYLQFYKKTKSNLPIPLLNYEAKAKKILRSLQKIVCISDKQLAFFKENYPSETEGKLTKIYNGYRTKESPSKKDILKSQLNILPSDFVFGMVSRGLPEKGWEYAIQALLQLDNKNAHLILVGESDYLRSLKEKYSSHKNIHFIGHSNEPLEWINTFDVGLLPSTYASESLPTVVIEYLYCQKPVIASDAGEIKRMVQIGNRLAGEIIPIKENTISITELTNSMARYINDKSHYLLHQANTHICFEQFDMDKCIDNYMHVYVRAMQNNG